MMACMADVGIYKLLKAGYIGSLKIKDLRLMEIKLNKLKLLLYLAFLVQV